MKLLLITSLFFCSAYEISANQIFERLNAQLNNAVQEIRNDITDNNYDQPQGPGLRALKKTDFASLQKYGCWCYFEEERGKGTPVDDFDAQCKELQDGYECIRLDSDESGDECDIWTTPYNSASGNGGLSSSTLERLNIECDASNIGNACAARICRVEGWFVQNVLKIAFSRGIQVDDQFSHDRGGFDAQNVCTIIPGMFSDKECCGEYPKRRPFKNQGGARQCCNGATYNALINKCCSDGSIKNIIFDC